MTSTVVVGRLYKDTGVATRRDVIGPISDRVFGYAAMRRHTKTGRRWSPEQYDVLRRLIAFEDRHGTSCDSMLSMLSVWDEVEELRQVVTEHLGRNHDQLELEEGRLSA